MITSLELFVIANMFVVATLNNKSPPPASSIISPNKSPSAGEDDLCKKSSLPPLAPAFTVSIKTVGSAFVVELKCSDLLGVPVPNPTLPSLP